MPDGGDEEIRTPDPLRARQVLSHLSYTPAVSSLEDPSLDASSKSNNMKRAPLADQSSALSGSSP